MSQAVGDKPAPMPLVEDDFICRFALTDGLKKGRFLDTLRRVYEVVGVVDCYDCPNSFLVTSKRYGNQLLKAIKNTDTNGIYTLQMEVAMLVMAEQVHPSMREHLMTMTDRGTSKDFSYVIVNRPGPTLEYIYRNLCAGSFSAWTLHHIAVQTMMALRELHHLGFVLRDLSLQSFCIGFGPSGEEQIFINQALAIRPYIDSEGALLRAANKAPIRPFSPYCSSRARLKDENCFPQQDAEAWLWMMTCLYDASWLPLAAEKDRAAKEHKALEIKEAIWKGTTPFPAQSPIPSCYRIIYRYLKQLEMADRVGYEHIRSLLEKCVPTGHATYPLDWTLVDRAKQLTEDHFLARCPKNKKVDADGDRTVTIRRDVHMDQHAFFTSRVVTTLKRNEASIETRSRSTSVSKQTVDGDKNKTSGPIAKIPEVVVV